MPEIADKVERLFKSQRFSEFISKLHPVNLQDDYRQHIAESILCSKNEWLTTATDEQLWAYAVGIGRRTATSTKTKFYRLHRKPTGLDIPENFCLPDESEIPDGSIVHALLTNEDYKITGTEAHNLRHKIAHHNAFQNSLFGMTVAVVNIPVYLTIDGCKDSDVLNDCLDALKVQIEGLKAKQMAVNQVGFPELVEVKFMD